MIVLLFAAVIAIIIILARRNNLNQVVDIADEAQDLPVYVGKRGL